MKLFDYIKQKKHKFAVMSLMAIGTVFAIGIAIVDREFSQGSLFTFLFFLFFAVVILIYNWLKK